ncbi:MAG: phosphomannomutase [Nitrospirae bacterium]|nr:phosphomannomutase [Nitrospirota bacterium]
MTDSVYCDAASCWKAILADHASNRHLLADIERFTRENQSPATVVFGTSGWRGETGTDFTFRNLRVVTAAIIEMFRTAAPETRAALGASGFDEIKQRGVIVGHDNRFLGPEFAREVMSMMREAGIRVFYAGEATTPELSAAIDRLGAACSINLTPSHNPANWSGFKFNPADGGPAGSEITGVIESIANRMMPDGAPAIEPDSLESFETIDPMALYEDFLNKRGTIDLDGIRDFIAGNDCVIVVDHVHGASRNRPERLLGASPKLRALRTGDDVLFGGIAPEPSAKNMAALVDMLRGEKNRFRLAVLIDPDGDRVRFTDGARDISMNHFGAMALHYLYKHKNIGGVLVKSVATSNFGNAIAERLGIPVRERPVGFKNFRPFMLPDAPQRAIVSYEESDGITGFNNTLEKDATFGLLLAIEMMAATGKNLSEYLADIEAEFGAFYPERAAIVVDKAMAGPVLLEKLASIRSEYTVGASVIIGDSAKTITDVITMDGTKIVFDDGSWLLIRPSGTEPKVRFYIETRSPDEQAAMIETARRMTLDALG